METQRGDEMLGFHPYFDIWHNQDGRAVSSTRRRALPQRKFLGARFCWGLSGPPGLLNADTRIRPLQNLFPGINLQRLDVNHPSRLVLRLKKG